MRTVLFVSAMFGRELLIEIFAVWKSMFKTEFWMELTFPFRISQMHHLISDRDADKFPAWDD